jgi:sporulation protein YlmC with PRC-barrel domain
LRAALLVTADRQFAHQTVLKETAMKLMTMIILASTALAPASAMAQGPAQPNVPNQDNQMRQVRVSEIQGKDVFTSNGNNVGQIDGVVIGQGNQAFAVVSFDDTLNLGDQSRIVPLSRMTFQNGRVIVAGMANADFGRLTPYTENMQGYREAPANQQVAFGADGQQMAQAGDASRIVVQQPAPTVRVNPAEPRVVVRQPQPQVTVNQPQPQIIVRQPQPTVRVDIPQPQIIVRMPNPDVNVAMAQPQVQVTQPKPQVQVTQPQQPQVQVEPSQPQVLVQREADAQPNVNVQRAGQPIVRYERAEPKVIVNQPKGEPNVRFEAMGQPNVNVQQQQQQQAQNRPAAAQAQPQTAQSGYTDEQRQAVRERLNAGDTETTGAVAPNIQTRPMAISNLEGTNVYNARGQELGDVDRVIVTPQGKRFVIVASGGFLGIGEDKVAFPLDRFWMRGNNLVIRGVTENDIDAMDDYRDTVDNFQRLSRNDTADLRVWQ